MKAICLDMYGVIVKQTGDDFVPYIQRFFPERTMEEIYIPWTAASVGEISSLDIWPAVGFTEDPEVAEGNYLATLEVMDGLLDFLKEYHGKVKFAIISNDTSRFSQYIRNRFGLNPYFDVLSISGDLGVEKPDPSLFTGTIEKLGVKPEDCIYVDDRVRYLNAAEKCGMKPVLMNTLQMPYDGKVVNNYEELKEYVDQVFLADEKN